MSKYSDKKRAQAEGTYVPPVAVEASPVRGAVVPVELIQSEEPFLKDLKRQNEDLRRKVESLKAHAADATRKVQNQRAMINCHLGTIRRLETELAAYKALADAHGWEVAPLATAAAKEVEE